MTNYRKYYSNRRWLFRNISNCLKNCFIKITQQINFWWFKRALWSGPYCTFRIKKPNLCTKNGQFAKHSKKNCFFGTEKFKNRCLEKYKYHIKKKYVSFFIVYRTRKKNFSTIKNFVINLTWNHPYIYRNFQDHPVSSNLHWKEGLKPALKFDLLWLLSRFLPHPKS